MILPGHARYHATIAYFSAAASFSSADAFNWWTRGTLTPSTAEISDRFSSSTK